MRDLPIAGNRGCAPRSVSLLSVQPCSLRLLKAFGLRQLVGSIAPRHWFQRIQFRISSSRLDQLSVHVVVFPTFGHLSFRYSSMRRWHRAAEAKLEEHTRLRALQARVSERARRTSLHLWLRHAIYQIQAVRACSAIKIRGYAHRRAAQVWRGGIVLCLWDTQLMDRVHTGVGLVTGRWQVVVMISNHTHPRAHLYSRSPFSPSTYCPEIDLHPSNLS